MSSDADTDELLKLAASGDGVACGALLDRHRPRLRAMLAVRMDDRLAARCDPSDVVQETLAEAAHRLPDYLDHRAIGFYPWLRQLAMQKLVDLHRHHRAQRRAVGRERLVLLSDGSAVALAQRLVSPQQSPSTVAVRGEIGERVREGLGRLDPSDREVLMMYHLEHLSVAEIAQVLRISETAVRSRRRRALERLSVLAKEWWETQ